MALYSYSILALDELKRYLGVQGTEKDDLLEDIANEVTDEFERHLGRLLVTRGAITEYHTLPSGWSLRTTELRPRQWPIITLTSVHESLDWPRVYTAATLLTVAEDYEIVRVQRDYIRRLGSHWPCGTRTVKLVYAAGYATTAAVPGRIKAQAKAYAALRWAELNRGAFGVSSMSDPQGNFTRFGAARITPDMAAALLDDTRVERSETAEAA